MRIISGLYKSRKISQVNLITTRETQDRIRLSIFNMLFDLRNKKCLDLFSGSGAMGIEAISNGASFCVFNDIERKAYETILSNLNSLKITKNLFKIYNLNYLSLLEKLIKTNECFDIIFIDPPYNFKDYDSLIQNLYNILEKDGKIIIELNKNTILKDNLKYIKIKEKTYGYKKIIILEKGEK